MGGGVGSKFWRSRMEFVVEVKRASRKPTYNQVINHILHSTMKQVTTITCRIIQISDYIRNKDITYMSNFQGSWLYRPNPAPKNHGITAKYPALARLLQELASKAHQSRGAASSRAPTSLALHVHLEGHLGGLVDSRLLVAALKKHNQPCVSHQFSQI